MLTRGVFLAGGWADLYLKSSLDAELLEVGLSVSRD